ncbi:hypothetical protein HUN01_28540 [Nostoc edaphicum CCNP1411]|uniref:Uncharacterized protein n=1 Tax=Nostoc edaphicum CCNP1411 TaxID=1472755 RepID=A0A7D7LEE6_9NOSO|nr:hypothetical protein [Nostoc edaphicum]QMS91353.1 hypothetical protein HUN01_28540 [Nostoc edaphicum CCNP1411]
MKNDLVRASNEIWGYRPEWDSPKSYSAFCVYRDFGVNRSLDFTAKTLNKSVGLINRWSGEGRWVERAEAFDIHEEEIARDLGTKLAIEKHVLSLEKYRSWCANLGWANLELAADCLDISKKSLEKYRDDPDTKLKPFEIKALSSAGVSSAEIGQKLISEALAVGKLLEQLPIDVDAEEIANQEEV